MEIIPILKGLATGVPFLYRADRGATGGTVSARYCYSIWMRHLTLVNCAGLPCNPGVVAELGPGDSLGIGLASLLSGARKLIALDVVKYANNSRNHQILDELVGLFARKSPIPGDDEFPDVFPRLPSYAFPSEIIDDSRLEAGLASSRIAAIHRALDGEGANESMQVQYLVPWNAAETGSAQSIDMVFSQAVLEHVEDLSAAYSAIRRLLAPQGVVSHVIDFRSHKLTDEWDGHLQYPEWVWRIVKGKRPYLLNRRPLSAHLALLENGGFKIKSVLHDIRVPSIALPSNASQLKEWTARDRETASAVVIASL